jgi:hypothetical protein
MRLSPFYSLCSVASTLAGGVSDAEALLAWCGSNPLPEHVQISRWLRHLASYSAETLASWK